MYFVYKRYLLNLKKEILQQAYNIIAYAANSYNGNIKKYNEDTYKHMVAVEKECIINGSPQKKIIS